MVHANRPGVPFCTHVEGGSLSCDASARPSSRHCSSAGCSCLPRLPPHRRPTARFPRSSSSSGRPAPPRAAIARRPARRPAIARQYTPDVVELYSPNATWTAVKDALKGASLVVYMGHGNGWPSRYRDSPLSDHAGRLRPQSDRRRRRLPAPVLRRGVDRLRGEAGQERRRAHEPPVLRERQLGAGAAGGHARRREAAGRQLRGRLHPGGCVGGDRRGMVEPLVLRAGHPRRRPVHPDGVAEESQRERAPDRFLERAQPGLRRADGSGERDLGLRAIDRHEERAGTEGCPGRRRRIGQRGSSAGGSARADA